MSSAVAFLAGIYALLQTCSNVNICNYMYMFIYLQISLYLKRRICKSGKEGSTIPTRTWTRILSLHDWCSSTWASAFWDQRTLWSRGSGEMVWLNWSGWALVPAAQVEEHQWCKLRIPVQVLVGTMAPSFSQLLCFPSLQIEYFSNSSV